VLRWICLEPTRADQRSAATIVDEPSRATPEPAAHRRQRETFAHVSAKDRVCDARGTSLAARFGAARAEERRCGPRRRHGDSGRAASHACWSTRCAKPGRCAALRGRRARQRLRRATMRCVRFALPASSGFFANPPCQDAGGSRKMHSRTTIGR